jgi:hypothetical protein
MLTKVAHRMTILIAVTGFAVVGSVVWSSSQATAQNEYVSKPNVDTDAGADKQQPTKTIWQRLFIIWDRTWDDPVAFYTFVLGIFTALLAIVSGTQIYFLTRADKTARITAEAAKKSAEIAEKSLLAANRPVIAIDTIKLCDSNELSVRPHIEFGLKNSGAGVAIVNNVSTTIQTAIPRALTLETNSKLVASDVHGAIAPGQAIGGLQVNSEILDTKEVQNIRAGKMALSVIFQIALQDIFHNPYNQTIPMTFNHQHSGFERVGLTAEQKPDGKPT